MLRRCLLIAILAAAVASGCAGEKGKELFDTAQFEEKQGNREHAAKLYNEIVQKYPGSELARKASARLAEIGTQQKATPQ
jgi:outer membrane protein assembly factor BamD (BamD/ComL family)